MYAIIHSRAVRGKKKIDLAKMAGAWHPASCGGSSVEAISVFRTEEDAWHFLLDGQTHPAHENAMRHAWEVVKLKVD